MTRYLLLAVIVVFGVGVSLVCHVAGRRSGEAFEVGIHNRTGADIEHAGVRGPAVDASMGFVVRGGNATYGLFRGPTPASADVRWTSAADGRAHAVTVPLSGVVPPTFDGTIYFTIHPDGTVSAEAVPLR